MQKFVGDDLGDRRRSGDGKSGMNVPGWIELPKFRGTGSGVQLWGEADGGLVDDGVAGNTRLTSATGMVLVLVLAVEAVTLLSVRQMITLHIFVGVMLLGPVVPKSGATIYRFLRYYGGSPAYRRKGPPHPLMRVLGPFLILSSFALLGSGLVLIFIGEPRSDGWVTLHQTFFWIWLVLVGVHLLGHLWEAAVTSWVEIRGSLSGRAARGRRWRFVVMVAALIIGVGAAVALLPSATSWTNRSDSHTSGPPRARP
jgi:hypothetical protein